MEEAEVVYLVMNDWTPSQAEENFLKSLNDLTGKVCISCEVWDQSMNYWITCEKSWLEKNFPRLLNDIVEKEPEHLDWKPENYGYHFITE